MYEIPRYTNNPWRTDDECMTCLIRSIDPIIKLWPVEHLRMIFLNFEYHLSLGVRTLPFVKGVQNPFALLTLDDGCRNRLEDTAKGKNTHTLSLRNFQSCMSDVKGISGSRLAASFCFDARHLHVLEQTHDPSLPVCCTNLHE